MKLENLFINDASPGVYIIAEMACAHDGDPEKAKKIIDAAVSAKADAVQLQFFSVEDLMAPDHQSYELLKRIEFSPVKWEEIYNYARKFSIDVFVCAYDVPSARLAIRLGADGIKLNSSDLSNPELLSVVAGAGLPFTLGTGASTIEEIAAAIDSAEQAGGRAMVLMHGVQNFPTDIENAHINRMKLLQSLFPYPVGYADHTEASASFSKVVDLLAIGAGAKVVEKHITWDRAEKGTDYQAALMPEEYKNYVELVRTAEKALGAPKFLPLSQSDLAYRAFQKKSIIAVKELSEGDVIKQEDLIYLRTGSQGIAPQRVNEIIGKKVVHPVAKYELIKKAHLE